MVLERSQINNRDNGAIVNKAWDGPIGSPPPKPIRIRIGYEWDNQVGSRTDPHWKFLRSLVKTAVDAVQKQSSKCEGKYPLQIQFGRLRARHGSSVTGSILKRIQKSDILLFDLTNLNPNVLFEAGCALAHNGTDSGKVFILFDQDKATHIPSDLQGYFFTFYKGTQLVDAPGFQPALINRIKRAAIAKEMWETKSTQAIET